MTGKDVLKNLLESTLFLTTNALNDLSDGDLQQPPVAGANNIAWQLGHLMAAERELGGMVGFSYPDLPPPLAGLNKTETAKTRPDAGKLPKADYISWFTKIRQATLAGLAKMSDADLGKPNSGPMKDFAPTLGAVLVLVGNHTMMHMGQFSVVRRALKKPVLM